MGRKRVDMLWIDEVAFYLSRVGLPVVIIVAVGAMLVVAYRKGLFSRKSLPSLESAPRTLVVHGDIISSNIDWTPAKNLQRVALEASNVDEYHRQSIAQSRISFWFSLAFAGLGFLIIATSVFAYSDKAGYLGVIAGTIIDAIAALFFYQSNRARQLMAEFFDRLRTDRKLEEALRLCDEINDGKIRDALRVRLSLHFSGIGTTADFIPIIHGQSGSHELPPCQELDKTPEDQSQQPSEGKRSDGL